MQALERGRYRARLAVGQTDLDAALALRARAFRANSTGDDEDAFDALCTHVLIEESDGEQPVACFRLMHLTGGAEIAQSYSAQFYELSALKAYGAPMVEMGRFCIDPARGADPDILRLAWGAMAAYVDAHEVEMLFGCSSFQGVEASEYYDAFALLRDRHLAPKRFWPKVKAPKVFRYASRLRRKPDLKRAMAKMPPLLRTYLMMGGWVSDHAVVDRDLGTLHVFTGLEIGAIPPARKRALRAVTG